MNINSQTIRSINKHASAVYTDLVHIRRALHQHPELSGDEEWTAHYIANKLCQLGLEVRTGVGGYGLVADLVTDPAKATVALRVDIDALPMQEINDCSYCSTNAGIMHACGHDVHSAVGVGVAAVLKHLTHKLPGNVRLIFQPEEEEISGALKMIQAGVLKNPIPKAILGIHVAPLPVGQIAWTDGLFLAGFDHYLVSLIPDEGFSKNMVDLDRLAKKCCRIILGLNRWQLPQTWEEMQAMWEKMRSGQPDLQNFIIFDASLDDEQPTAWHGQFGLGIKAANDHLRRTAMGRIRAALNPLCLNAHVRCQIEPMGTMPDLVNDAHLVHSTLTALAQAIDPQHIIQIKAAFPFNCEDFAYYTKYVPGAMYWLGGANPKENKFAMLHTPDFDVDERCLLTATNGMTALVFELLASNSK